MVCNRTTARLALSLVNSVSLMFTASKACLVELQKTKLVLVLNIMTSLNSVKALQIVCSMAVIFKCILTKSGVLLMF